MGALGSKVGSGGGGGGGGGRRRQVTDGLRGVAGVGVTPLSARVGSSLGVGGLLEPELRSEQGSFNSRRGRALGDVTCVSGSVASEQLSKLAECWSYPTGYLSSRLGLRLYGWQERVLLPFSEPGSRVAAVTCNESGKTSVCIAGLVMWHLETFRDSLTVTTSATYRQIVSQLYPALRSYASRCGGSVEVQKDSAYCSSTGSRLLSFTTDDPGRAEGYHEPLRTLPLFSDGENPLAVIGVSASEWSGVESERTSLLMILDEAKTIGQGVFDAVERCHPTRLLVMSSPGVMSGPFFDCFHAHRSRYVTVKATWRDCPHLVDNDARCAELLEQRRVLGEKSSLVLSMQDAEFMSQGESRVFDMEKVEQSMCGLLPVWGQGDVGASLDVSIGGDESVLYYRNGNEIVHVKSWHTPDDELLVRDVIRELERLRLRADQVVADDGGLGAVILNSFQRKGWGLNRLRGENKARNPKWYANVRAEMYFSLSDRIRRGELRLPRDELLKAQLGAQQYLPVNPLQLVPKSMISGSGWRSPDRSDAVAMLCYHMPLPGQLVPGVGLGAVASPWSESRTIPNEGPRAAWELAVSESESLRDGGYRERW